jgi:hypothetical protein
MGAAVKLLVFDRDTACPVCGIAIEIRRVCRERHADLDGGGDRGTDESFEHLHVECPGCGWPAFMETATHVPGA